MRLEFIPLVWAPADIGVGVWSLRVVVGLHDPVELIRHKWPQDHGAELRVLAIGPETVTDVMKQGAQHVGIVTSRSFRSGSRLQGVRQMIDDAAAVDAAHGAKILENSIGKAGVPRNSCLVDLRPI